MWDEHCLYVGFECEDTDLEAKPAVRDDAVYGDDAVELFISPDIRFRSYWEIVTNINGVVFDSIECKHSTTWGPDLDPTQNVEGLKVATKLRGTVNDPSDKDQGYTVEMALPWTALLPQKSSRAQPGDQYGFMLCRIDRNASGTKAYSYQPLLGWGHNVWNMATMELLPKAR